ncbi:hypothetical protein [Blastomonas sp.]|uniref:hypothetical protein n=1 Tax=Blastomonas sp. TaxID=1909299 RepID=UPI00391DF80F
MVNIEKIIERINALLHEDTDASVCYAALEARLALEKVCYDRLRQRHDYISHADLKAWTPRHVVKRIMEEVDGSVALTKTLSISKGPAREGVKPEDEDYVEVGTEVGFKPQHIASLWQALSNLALHVRVPEHRDDQISAYGDRLKTRAKVAEVVGELERLAKGTMIFSGFGDEVSFECPCGQKNRRRAGLLKVDQIVSCFSESCSRSYKVTVDDDGSFIFQLDTIKIPCEGCGKMMLAPRSKLFEMRYEEPANIKCIKCGHQNQIEWKLARLASIPKSPDDKVEG